MAKDREKLLRVASLCLLAVLYFITAPKSVTFEDAGLFLSTSFNWGIPHPPGYPLYTFLTYLFMKIPIGTPAQMASGLSCLLGLGAVRISYAIFKRLNLSPMAALFGMLCFGLGQTFWNQVTVPEVYALHIFLFVGLIYCSLRLRENWTNKYVIKFVVLFGLSLANHWPLLILSSPMLLLLMWPQRQIFIKKLHYLLGSAAIAMIFYGLMYMRSHSEAGYLFLGPINGFGELFKYIAREYYKVSDAQAPFMPIESLKFIASFLWTQFLVDLTPVIGLLGIFGIWRFQNKNRNSLGLALLFAFFSTPVLLMIVLHFEFNELNYNVYRVFHLIPHFTFCFLAAYGFERIYKSSYKLAGMGFAFSGLIIAAGLNFQANNLSQDQMAEDYAKLLLDTIPENATLFAATDADVGPMAYVVGVLGYRDDIELMTQTGVLFLKKMFDPYEFGRNFRARATEKYLVENAPLYSTKRFDILKEVKNIPLNFKYNGIYYLVTESYNEEAPKPQSMIDEAKRIAEVHLENSHLNNWQYHRDVVMARLCNLMVLNNYEDHRAFTENRACQIIKSKHLRRLKKHDESSKLIRDIIENKSRFMVKSELMDLYHMDLMNQVDWVNYGLDGNKRLAHVVTAVDYASDGLGLYGECDNPIYELIKSIKPQLDWTEKTQSNLEAFKDCK